MAEVKLYGWCVIKFHIRYGNGLYCGLYIIIMYNMCCNSTDTDAGDSDI